MVVLLLVIHLIGSIITVIGYFNVNESELSNKPITSSWTKRIKKILGVLSRTIFRVCGINVTSKGNIASTEEAPILVMAPHASYFDAVLMWWSNTPSCVIAADKINIPIYGKTWKLFSNT